MATRVGKLPKYRRKDLVVLIYAPNPCYILVRTLEEVEGIDALAVSCQTGMWQYREGQNRAIGESNGGLGGGVIGVYDKTQISHLNRIVGVVESILHRNQPGGHGDD